MRLIAAPAAPRRCSSWSAASTASPARWTSTRRRCASATSCSPRRFPTTPASSTGTACPCATTTATFRPRSARPWTHAATRRCVRGRERPPPTGRPLTAPRWSVTRGPRPGGTNSATRTPSVKETPFVTAKPRVTGATWASASASTPRGPEWAPSRARGWKSTPRASCWCRWARAATDRATRPCSRSSPPTSGRSHRKTSPWWAATPTPSATASARSPAAARSTPAPPSTRPPAASRQRCSSWPATCWRPTRMISPRAAAGSSWRSAPNTASPWPSWPEPRCRAGRRSSPRAWNPTWRLPTTTCRGRSPGPTRPTWLSWKWTREPAR